MFFWRKLSRKAQALVSQSWQLARGKRNPFSFQVALHSSVFHRPHTSSRAIVRWGISSILHICVWFPFLSSEFIIQGYPLARKDDTSSPWIRPWKQAQASSAGFIRCSQLQSHPQPGKNGLSPVRAASLLVSSRFFSKSTTSTDYFSWEPKLIQCLWIKCYESGSFLKKIASPSPRGISELFSGW